MSKPPASHPRKAPALPGPPAFHKQTLRRRLRNTLITLAVLALVVLIDRVARVLPVQDDWHRYHGQSFEVVRVIDGDTLDIRAPDGDRATTRVRLWGVNCPEIANPTRNKPADPGADAAADHTRRRAQGARVTLTLQRHQLRGRYGRLLAYVELPDGTSLNRELLTLGLAKQDDRWGHDRLSEDAAAQAQSKRAGLGLWSD